MKFNKHDDLIGSHAFLSASKYHWIRYDDDRLLDSYRGFLAVSRGTQLHDFAAQCIRIGQRLPKSKKTLNCYVNDAIGYRMTPEQVLYFSPNCYGTADAISFRNDVLRIHDLKTGEVPAHMEQLLIYAALFCLEYKIKPSRIGTELRIYQGDEVLVHTPEAAEIDDICEKIIHFDKLLTQIKQSEQ